MLVREPNQGSFDLLAKAKIKLRFTVYCINQQRTLRKL